MKVWAITQAKDEAEILEYSIRQLFAEGIDGMIVADNMSTDGTRALVARLTREFNIQLVADEDPGFNEAGKRTFLVGAAGALGAHWIIPFDADELFYCDLNVSVANRLRGLPSHLQAISVPMWNYVATAADDFTQKNPFKREGWRRRERNPLSKVCFRYRSGIQLMAGSHGVVYQGAVDVGTYVHIDIGHFQNRSAAHLIKKIRTESIAAKYFQPPDGVGYWHKFGHMTDEEITAWWQKDYFFEDPAGAGLVYSPAPYHGFGG